MSKKDFVLIAGVLAASRDCAAVDPLTLRLLALNFADALADTNVRFDRDRFLNACKVGN
jgi:uncharacterized protein (DUF362 family)